MFYFVNGGGLVPVGPEKIVFRDVGAGKKEQIAKLTAGENPDEITVTAIDSEYVEVRHRGGFRAACMFEITISGESFIIHDLKTNKMVVIIYLKKEISLKSSL